MNPIARIRRRLLREDKAQIGLFWIIPTKDGQWEMLHIPTEYFKTNWDHDHVWRDVVAGMILQSFNKKSDVFKSLFEAFPRGRMEEGDVPLHPSEQRPMHWWVIGFGGDYPPGWNEDRLRRTLGVGPINSEIELHEHWHSKPNVRKMAHLILGTHE
jgi:hypothetical protein